MQMMKSITDLNEGEPKPKKKREKKDPAEKGIKGLKGAAIKGKGKKDLKGKKGAIKAAKPVVKRQATGAIGGLSKPLLLSDELSGLLGVRQDSRCQVNGYRCN
jgi:fatty acid/phospholipid biosynthesis enzyme